MKNKIPQQVLGPHVNIMGKIQLLVPKIAGVLSILLRDSNMAILPIYGIKKFSMPIMNGHWEYVFFNGYFYLIVFVCNFFK